MATVNPARKRRRRWRTLVVLLLVLVAAVAALPWGLGTPPARRWLLARADRALAPARLEVATIRLSWFGPTRLTGFALRDAQGDRVIAAPVATWDRNLRQILFGRPRLGTLVLQDAALDVERRADGSVDLYEAIRPILSKDPRTDLHIRVPRGRLRFRDAGQPVPVTADRADLALDVHAAPGPVAWRLRLENPEVPRPATLEINGEFDRWGTPARRPGDLGLDVAGERWPWSVTTREVTSSGTFDGRLAVGRRSGRWSLSGQAALLGLDATGPRLAGDHLRLGRVAGDWDLAQTDDGWALRRLDLASPVGSLKATGTLASPTPSGVSARVEGTLDLAALARQLPHALRLREGTTLERGSAHLRVEAGTGAEGHRQAWDVEAKVSDLVARDHGRELTLRDPATLSARIVGREAGGVAVDRMAVQTAFLTATGRGDVDQGVAWSGSLDLGGLRRQLHDLVDFGGVDLEGKGDLTGHYRRSGATFEGRAAADLRDVRIGELARDAVHLDLSADGPAGPSGLPESWSTLRLGLAADSASAELAARSGVGTRSVAASFRAPVSLAGRRRRAEGRLDARWDGDAVTVDRLSVGLLSEGKGKGEGGEPITLEARGRYDRGRGEVVLTPAASDPRPRALALAPEGLRVSGIGRPDALKVSGGLTGDVEAMGRLLAPDESSPALGLAGTWSARATAESTGDGLRVVGKVALPDLTSPADGGRGRRAEGPVEVSFDAIRPRGGDRIELAELAVASRYATFEGSGRLDDPAGTCLADLRGTLEPDWRAINAVLAERVEPGAHLSGKARAWRLRGPLSGGSLSERLGSLDGEFGFDLVEADIYGLHVGSAPIVVRASQGRLGLDPIDATLNGGRLHLEPELALDDERGAAIRLGPASTIVDAEINDEVSRRFLSYVAPVLDRATRAHGRVSVRLKEAVFPLGGAEPRGTTVEGAVVFQEVEFLPGPFVDELLDLIGLADRPSLKLDEPVALTIADRRVYQKGLALPLGRLTRIELDGWVDFDRNIRLTASLPITPAMVGNAPVLSALVEGQRVRVPISGTLRAPQIDRDAMDLALKDLGKSLLENGAVRGAAELLQRLRLGRDPNAPPPPTREERRARRMERKAERRGQGP